MTLDEAHLRRWIGRSQSVDGEVTAWPADVLNATFDRDDAPLQSGDAIPPGWHWYYFPEVVKLAETGADGHAAKGGFMPPVPLPFRMWAGVSMTFHRPIRVGERITRTSTITEVEPKAGASGPLCFVVQRHELAGADGLATTEDHTTVYRGATDPDAPPPPPRPAPAEALWWRTIEPSPVLLFRYSALTMNSHRIHYDRSYVTEEEGYPGLLVHGNLTATLLLDLFRREMPAATLKTFSVRAVAPLYDTNDFAVEGAPGDDGRTAKLWAVNHAGALAQSAEVAFDAQAVNDDPSSSALRPNSAGSARVMT